MTLVISPKTPTSTNRSTDWHIPLKARNYRIAATLWQTSSRISRQADHSFHQDDATELALDLLQLISQLTTRVRLYGADCNQTALVLEAIKQTNVNMQVYVGNYVVPDDNVSYTRQRDTIKDAIQTYGVDHIAGITVGNEFMLK
ncbi:hypothetical protein C0991_003556 [Blastosporella zonata]|nr:hypothetical protein C0991_003556 [Blastosporella zonata]